MWYEDISNKYHHVKDIFVKTADDRRTEILEGPIFRTIIVLALPVIVSSALHTGFNIVDTYWLGKLGSAEVGAPTAAWPIIFSFLAIGMGLSTAGVSLVSQHTGAGGTKEANEAAGQVFSFLMVLGVLTAALGFVGAPYILSWIGTPPNVLPLATSYLRIVGLSMPFVFAYIAFRFLLRGVGDMVTPMLIRGVLVLVNLIIDPFLIFGWSVFPELGVTGAAIATALARTTSALVGIYLLFNGKVDIKLTLKSLKLKLRWVKKIVKIGFPATVARSESAIGFILLFALVAIFGENPVAAYGIGRRVIHVMTIGIWGFAGATMTMVGQNIGADNKERGEEIVKKAIMLSFTVLVLLGLFVVLLRNHIMMFFIGEPAVISEGARYLAIFSMSIPFFGIYRIFDSTFKGTGHTLPVMLLTLFRIWVLRLFLSALFALTVINLGIISLNIGFGIGVVGIWYGMAASNIIGAGLSSLYFFSGRWKSKTIDT
ncbi:MAG: MATE family efflux transporter [Candidatus Saliniplasma sp.]